MSRSKTPSKVDADKTKAELRAELCSLRHELREIQRNAVSSNGSPQDDNGLPELAELRRNEGLLDGILDIADDVIITIDQDQRITRFNKGAQQAFGYRPEEAIGQRLDMLLPEQFREAHGDHVRNFQTGSADSRMMNERADIVARRKDGTTFPARASISRVEQDGLVALTVFLHDISDIRQAEQAVRQSRNELAHGARVGLMGELSASIAHELNQPLAAILANAQVLKRQIEAAPGDLNLAEEATLDLIHDARRAGEFVQRLRALLRPGKRDFDTLQLNDVVAEVLNVLSSEIIMRQMKIVEELAPDLPAVVGDRILLQQTALNLLTNAFDSIEDNDAPERRIIVRTSRAGADSVELCISDTGAGFPREDYARLFEPFHTTKDSGMGVGLAICRTIVKEHDGKIWAENNRDGGASFYVSLPIASVKDAALGDADARAQDELSKSNDAGIVFIVDDDSSVRRSFARLIGSAGYKTETFATAREFLRRDPYKGSGCLVVDLHMPGESGLDLQNRLNARGYSMPIIFITGAGTTSYGVQAMKEGAADFLTKPIDYDLLLKSIERAIDVDKTERKRFEQRRDAEERIARLSPREAEIMALVVQGYRNKQIAHELGISEGTVKVHRGNVMEKTEVESLAHLVQISELIGGDES